MSRVSLVKSVLWAIVGIATAVGLGRFLFGLGAVTNLTDATPWGLWIGFDVMGGVALAAGGFVITAIVYILKREEFRPIVKPAILTAFLGYLAVITSLIFDLGLPWNIWHMLIFWNPHSPLFEVGWCVMLYTTVLLLEFSPVPLEASSRYARIRAFLIRFRFPLVLLGIMFSTLHQSSLGSLLLIVPFKLHPLWHTGLLPILFFVSAVGLGLMMITLEGLVSSYLYKRDPEVNLFSKLARAAIWVLSVYLTIRLADIILSGKGSFLFAGTWESVLFWVELMISSIFPIILFLSAKSRINLKVLWIGSTSVVAGFVLNRINVGGLTMLRTVSDPYVPSWMEFAISAGVVSAAVLAFLFAVERFNIWDKKPTEISNSTRFIFDRPSNVWLGDSKTASRTKNSLIFIISVAVGLAVVPWGKARSGGKPEVSSHPAVGGKILFIDANRDGYGVEFNHEDHQKKNGGDSSCALCHHMNLPLDRNSACFICHAKMYSASDMFDHDLHANGGVGKILCNDCHQRGQPKSGATAARCDKCHKDLSPTGEPIKFTSYWAPSYVDAMHGVCVGCHRAKAKVAINNKNIGLCSACHKESFSTPAADFRSKYIARKYNRVVLPLSADKWKNEKYDEKENSDNR